MPPHIILSILHYAVIMNHYRLLLPLTIFFAACVGSQPAEAGVIVDSNGIVTEFTTTTGGTDITYKFYEGSFASTQSTSSTTTGKHFDYYEDFYTGLQSDLKNYSGTETLSTSVSYVITYEIETDTIRGFPVNYSSFFAEWQFDPNGVSYDKNATGEGPGHSYYFASLTAPTSTVPEPSTAIAMGLLGVVGFAGNRRRRRQVSAA